MPITAQIDPRVYQGLTPIPSPAEQEAEQLKLSEARAKRQQVIDAAQDQAAMRTALQTNIGEDGIPDFDAAIRSLSSTNARAATTLQQIQSETRQKQSEAQTKQLEADTKEAEFMSHVLQGVTADNYDTALSVLPDRLKQVLGPTYDKTKVDFLVNAGTATAEFNKKATDALQHYLKGDYRKAIAEQIAIRPEAADQILQDARENWNAPLSDIQAFKSVPPDQLQAFAQQAALTEDQRQTNREQAATREQTVANQAATREDTAAYRAAQLAQGQQRIGLEAQRLKQSASGTSAKSPDLTAADPTEAAAIAGYVQAVKNQTLPLANVPAEGHMRNKVMAALNDEGVSVSKLTAADLSRKNIAKTILPKIDSMQVMAQQIKDLGLMGSIRGRWRKLVAGESLATDLAGLTPEQKQLVGRFASEASGLLVSGIAMAHGGARGGGSPQVLEQVKSYLDPASKDLDVYIGNLLGAKEFMNGYAHMGEPEYIGKGHAPAGDARKDGEVKTFPNGKKAVWQNGAWHEIK